MNRPIFTVIGCLLGMVALLSSFSAPVHAAAPVCARVKIEILQELAFERIAFDARLIVTNSTTDQNLDNMSVNVQITDAAGTDMKDKFFIKVVSLDKISAVDGTGTIPPQVAAEVHWMLIPSPGAGGTLQTGVRYFVGGEVNYSVAGTPQNMTLMPAVITVKPQPELVLDYFLPREVWADDPFTDTVEAPIPFHLGVRTNNTGYGQAANLTINSGQPKIVENKQGLLIDFRLLGSNVNDSPVTPTLNLNMGTIKPQSCATGRWEMITTLSGRFVDFNASFTHASELGGTLTSLIKTVKAHFLTHEVLVDTPGSDLIRDFLSYDDPTGSRMPDSIFTSDCRQLPVNVSDATVAGTPLPGNPTVTLTNTQLSGWIYSKVVDPGNGKLNLTSITRSDGKKINLNNAWISEEKPTSKQQDPSVFYLNLVDLDTTGNYQVAYETPPVDTTPPVTVIEVTEPKYGTDPIYVKPTTEILFTATDDLSGVLAMVYNLDGRGETPALPFTFQREIIPPATLAGPHTVTYYSRDRSGNVEQPPKTAHFFVDDSPPAISTFTVTPATITPSSPDSSVLARQTFITSAATDAIAQMTALYEVARGTATDDAGFAALPLVRTISGPLLSGTAATTTWAGRDSAGNMVPAGTYTIRFTATDQLGNRSAAFGQVSVSEYLAVRPLSSTIAGQINPSLSGNRVAWQDYRNGKWDIFLLDLGTSTETNLTTGKIADQTNPSIDGTRLVWQDRTTGNWDIVLYDLTNSTEKVIASTLADETNPVISGNWVAWQAGASGNRDIYAYSISDGTTRKITTGGARDHIHPAISGSSLVWEDYRNGLGDIYAYDLISGVETPITNNTDNQTAPHISGNSLVWVDQRNGNRELYTGAIGSATETRLTYTLTDEAQPYLNGTNLVYVDYGTGLNDPNLSIINLTTRRSTRILSEPHRQEQPRLDGSKLVWQDDRSGVWQIYFSEIPLAQAVVSRQAVPGLNLVGVNASLKSRHQTAFGLLNAWKGTSPVKAVETYQRTSGTLLRAEFDVSGTPLGSDFPLAEQSALYLYADNSVTLNLGDMGVCGPLSIPAGFSMVSHDCLPDNFMASDLARSLGLSIVQSISRFDQLAARWLTVAVQNGSIVGQDFPIVPGEGYLIYTSADINGWIP